MKEKYIVKSITTGKEQEFEVESDCCFMSILKTITMATSPKTDCCSIPKHGDKRINYKFSKYGNFLKEVEQFDSIKQEWIKQ